MTFDENFEGGSTTNMSVLSTAKILANAPEVSARAGWTFVGWYTVDGKRVTEADLPTNGATYYAHWFEGEFTTGGDATWFVGDDGNWRSGMIPDDGWQSWLKTGVKGPGTLSFEWKVSSQEWSRYLYFRVDGETKESLDIYGETTDWLPVQYEVGEGEHEFELLFLIDDELGSDYGAMRNWTWTPTASSDQVVADAVADAIDEIGEVAYTDASKAKIDAARAAYDALTPAQQALVTNYATLTAAEAAYAALAPSPDGPCYAKLEEGDITDPYAAAKTVTLAGAVYDGCDVVGIVNLKLGKVNAKKKTGKVSGSVTLLDGKKRTVKSVSVTGIDGASPKTLALSVKGLGTMNVTIGGTRFAGSLGGYHVQSAAVGGKWTRADAKVYVAFGGAALPAGTIEDLLPDGEPVIPRGGKWAFGKASSVKYAKDAKTKVLTLTVNDRNGTARNRSAMKLSYNPKTGVFKGSFKVYAIQGGKLKKITVKVNGVVADGDGHGRATVPKSGVFAVTVE